MKVKYQQIWIVVFACLVIALYVLSKLFPFPIAGSASGAAFDEAVIICEKEARSHFGAHLGYIKFDKSSSRYDKPAERHRIFFNAQLSAPRIIDLYILCAVDAENGKLVQLDAVEQSASTGNNKENKFGWPTR